MTSETHPLDPVADVARALSRLITPAPDPWAKYPAILRVEHVAELLDVKPDSVRADVRRGHIPMRKKCGAYRIDQVAFRAWLASMERAS